MDGMEGGRVEDRIKSQTVQNNGAGRMLKRRRGQTVYIRRNTDEMDRIVSRVGDGNKEKKKMRPIQSLRVELNKLCNSHRLFVEMWFDTIRQQLAASKKGRKKDKVSSRKPPSLLLLLLLYSVSFFSPFHCLTIPPSPLSFLALPLLLFAFVSPISSPSFHFGFHLQTKNILLQASSFKHPLVVMTEARLNMPQHKN